MFVFGGLSTADFGNGTSDTWEVHALTGTPTWTQLNIPDAGVPRFANTIVTESVNSSGLILYGGRTSNNFVNDEELVRLNMGCNAGYYSESFLSSPCLPCKAGTYSANPGHFTSCPSKCPGLTTTKGNGPWTSFLNCTECAPSACNGHGSCSSVGTTTFCDCTFWYRNSDNCKTPVNLIIFVSVLCGSVVIFLLVLVYKKYRKRFVNLLIRSSLTEQLLDETREELIEMKKVWEISAQDMELSEHIDSGSFGEVNNLSFCEKENTYLYVLCVCVCVRVCF